MSRHTPIDHATGELKRYLVRRIFDRLTLDCAAEQSYTRVRYADLAHLVGLPWVWNRDNAATIVVLRAAIARLESVNLISVRGSTHTEVLVKLLGKDGAR